MNNKEIYINNTLTGKKEKFKPIKENFVGIYVCGPTVYSEVHLGNCRTFVFFDTLVRYFHFLGYKVRYVRNITDVGHLVNDADEGEDKIAKKAKIEQLEPMEIVQKYTLNFHEVMRSFNNLPPDIEPTATGHINEQISMVEKILKNGFAYEVNGSVYFDVKKFLESGNDYGELSGRNIEDLLAGSRDLDGQQDKKSPQDFALWKNADDSHIMKWDSPWGVGFPGWHLECSAMSSKYLGNKFDIHGGGMDLKFPHHECEIAQAKGANHEHPVNYWVHSNMLTLNGKRMSKSTGNTILPFELFTGSSPHLTKSFSPSVVRFFMLQAHYSGVLDFSNEALIASEKGFRKLMNAFDLIKHHDFVEQHIDEQQNSKVESLCSSCFTFMSDDFNTPKVIASLFELVSIVNHFNSTSWSISNSTFELLQKTFCGFIEEVLGLENEITGNSSLTNQLIELVLELRKDAKANKNYQISDKIRDELVKIGVEIKDGKDTTSYTIKN